MKKNIHTVSDGNGWSVKKAGQEKPLSHHFSKKTAQERGRIEAINRGVEHVIHGRDGKIQDKDSYGRDPHPPHDRKH